MKIQLSKGEADVVVRHLRERPPDRTTVSVTLPGGWTVRSNARCSPEDQFCKKTGRLIAARRAVELMRKNHPELNAQDRRTVFRAVCPEYAP